MTVLFNGYFYTKEKNRLGRAAELFLQYFKINRDVNFNLASLDIEEICKQNFNAFNRNEVTDVVTLPIYKNLKDIKSKNNTDGFVGDILIHRPEVRRNALLYGKTMVEELELVLIHGMLHLFGFSHNNESLLSQHQEKIIKRVWNES